MGQFDWNLAFESDTDPNRNDSLWVCRNKQDFDDRNNSATNNNQPPINYGELWVSWNESDY